jgi:4-hydroxybenzoate polyprenyltransferase
MSYTDLNLAHWVLARLPAWARPYALLARWDRPIGTWLLLLPCWWALALADCGWLGVWYGAWCAVGALVMRGAGCTINDIIDRKLDAQVERTKQRPLPSGAISLWQALGFLGLQLAVGSLVLAQFPLPAMLWGAASLLLVGVYPLMKRITWWPQFVLGLTFNWGALLGWVAVRGHIELPAFLLYAGAVAWTIMYDTIYAQQDAADDAAIGVKSTARLFGDNSRRILAFFAAGAAALFLLAGYAAQLGGWFYPVWMVAVGHLGWQIWTWRLADPADCLRKFRSNRDFGFLLLGAIMIGKLF